MDILKFTGTIKNLGDTNKSFIPIHDEHYSEFFINIKNTWDFLTNNSENLGFNLNYIKLITYNATFMIIINNYNDIIIIDIVKCYELMDNNTKIFCKDIIAVKKLEKNDNIIKINLTSFSKKMKLIDGSNYYKLVILTENYNLYYMQIDKASITKIYDLKIILLSNNIYDYFLFDKDILIRKIIENTDVKELYYVVNCNTINLETFNSVKINNDISNIDLTKGANVIKRIYTESPIYYNINNIFEDKTIRTFSINKYNGKTRTTDSVFLSNTNGNDNIEIISTLCISNAMLMSYYDINIFYIKCMCNNTYHIDNDHILVNTESRSIHSIIMIHTFYILKKYNDVTFFTKYGTFVFNIFTNKFDHNRFEITDINQIKINEELYMHQPYLTLDNIINDEYFKSILIMLIHHIGKLNIQVPILCWDIIFSFMKPHNFLKNTKLEMEKKRKQYNSLILTNKKQKI